MDTREIGAKLRILRKAAGLSTTKLAERAGMSQSSVSYIERGENNPTTETLQRLLSALGVTWSEFFAEDPDQNLALDDHPILESDLDAYLRQHDLWFKGQPLTYAEKLAARQAIELLRKAMEASKGETREEDQEGES